MREPLLVIETRRTSASSSEDTSNSSVGRQRPVLAREFGAILVEGDMIVVGFATARLKARRPDLVAVNVAQKNIGAEIVAGAVFAPAGHARAFPSGCSRSRLMVSMVE